MFDNMGTAHDDIMKKMAKTVQDARNEFGTVRSTMEGLFSETGQTFREVANKVMSMQADIDALNQNTGKTGRAGEEKYLPRKYMMPKPFGKDPSGWKRFRDDMSEYFDMVSPGMSSLLKRTERHTGPFDSAWESEVCGHDSRYRALLTDDHMAAVYATLKKLTEGEANTVVLSAGVGKGLHAWVNLHERYSQSLAAEQGKA